MSVSHYSKMIKNGSQMTKRCDLKNFDKKMQNIIDSIELRPYLSNTSTHPPILMYSVPGCGKTYLVRAIIQKFEEEYDYLWIDNSDIMSSYYGETQKQISAIFESARKHNKPVILFFDENDGLFGEHKDSQSIDLQNIATFKQETDGNKDNSNIVLICATNHIDKICDAIKSRFPNQYEFNLPDYDQRVNFFRNKFKNVANKLKNSDFSKLANRTDGKSFRELEKVFNDLIEIAANLNKNATYFIVGHGIDIHGKEKDLLYVAVPRQCDECIVMRRKTKEFISNLAQIPITSSIINSYFDKYLRNIFKPQIPPYDGPVYDSNSIINEKNKKEKIENKKKKLMIGSVALGFIIFSLLYIISRIIFGNKIQKNPYLRVVNIIINGIISYCLIMWMDPTGETDIEKLHPVAKYIRQAAGILGEIIEQVVLQPIMKRVGFWMKVWNKVTNIAEKVTSFVEKVFVKPAITIRKFVKSTFGYITNFFRHRIRV